MWVLSCHPIYVKEAFGNQGSKLKTSITLKIVKHILCKKNLRYQKEFFRLQLRSKVLPLYSIHWLFVPDIWLITWFGRDWFGGSFAFVVCVFFFSYFWAFILTSCNNSDDLFFSFCASFVVHHLSRFRRFCLLMFISWHHRNHFKEQVQKIRHAGYNLLKFQNLVPLCPSLVILKSSHVILEL